MLDPVMVINNNICTCTANTGSVNSAIIASRPVIWLIRLQSNHRPAVNDCRIAYSSIVSTHLLSHCKCGEVLTVYNTNIIVSHII